MTEPTLEDDDDDHWLPLDQESTEEPEEDTAVQQCQAAPRTTQGRTSTTLLPRRSANDHEEDLRRLQNKLEANTKLKKSLVDHPLDQSWQRFIVHLSRELWGLDLSVRVGKLISIPLFDNLMRNEPESLIPNRWYRCCTCYRW